MVITALHPEPDLLTAFAEGQSLTLSAEELARAILSETSVAGQ